MVALKYRFDNLADVVVGVGSNGGFDQLFNLTGLRSGTHTLTVTGSDVAGNAATSQFFCRGFRFPVTPTLLRVEAASDSGVSGV